MEINFKNRNLEDIYKIGVIDEIVWWIFIAFYVSGLNWFFIAVVQELSGNGNILRL